jgi:hypothetical protein
VDNELRHRRRIQPVWIVGLLFLVTRSSAAGSELDLASYLAEVRDRNPVIQSARARAAELDAPTVSVRLPHGGDRILEFSCMR